MGPDGEGPPAPEYRDVELDQVRCPNCGNEEGITETKAANKHTQPVPPDRRAGCPECDHNGDPLAFHHEWQWERMSEEEREEARAAQERMADEMAEHQYSAHYLHSQVEP